MAIEDDIALFSRVPTLNLLGAAAMQVLAIGAEQRDYGFGDKLFEQGEPADAGFIVRRGAFRVASDDGSEAVAGQNALIGELALVVAMARPATATALEPSSVLRISRSLFQRVLESHPDAALRLRDEFAARSTAAAGAMSRVSATLR
ncbi:cyclic nucleotide-binding domain-containing protein [Bradyrhizobium sp. G127]|jgi:CRP-like cAMP-binding protein|uniref:cyclic nucleotide-binding domain-containing protein n=1 Tax=Bradyrhizobium sp. G127 TaxID=2904800 RepID=UPI001F1D48C3|nr:cyclic nucleotide-binding domain-containing protein [Bradyrhizobium sp. G127]MCF2521308.1 cyclic nucleotide-binding domain-containing protein [Bradyrhizobium sp. G127]